jgi:hypothetical protein
VAALGANIPSNKSQAAVDAFLGSKPPADNQPFIAGAASIFLLPETVGRELAEEAA